LPAQVKGVGNSGLLTNVVDISIGLAETIAIKDDGTAVSWGYNPNGGLGDNSATQRNVPVVVKGENNIGSLEGIMMAAAGHKHMTAVKEDGSVWSWGLNAEGELGNDLTTQKNTPICISYPEITTDVSYIEFNEIEDTQTVVPKLTPGFNLLYNSLPSEGYTFESMNENIATVDEDGVITSKSEGNTFIKITETASGIIGGIKVVVMPQKGIAFPMLVAGDNHMVALRANGEVWTWGRNDLGQLGLGDTIARDIPTFTGITEVYKIAAGYDHTLILKKDGTVWAFGQGTYGKLGNGAATNSPVAVQVKGEDGYGILSDIIDISAGGNSSYALKKDGTVYSWGYNNVGQLGNSTTANKSAPVRVRGIKDIIQISAGNANGYALRVDGTVWSWGQGSEGRCGDGATSNRSLPVQVNGMGAGTILEEIIQISAGGGHVLALAKDSTIWAWGYNAQGSLGDGTSSN
jgi:alpha-tubulin suppressor-like RCC1 family protein